MLPGVSGSWSLFAFGTNGARGTAIVANANAAYVDARKPRRAKAGSTEKARPPRRSSQHEPPSTHAHAATRFNAAGLRSTRSPCADAETIQHGA